MKKAIIYCRFSPRPNADECKSNEKQEERCRAYCASKGYEVLWAVNDSAVSGKSAIASRPGLASAIGRIESGMVLVVDTSDRLARDMLVALTIRYEIEKRGATIEFADGSPLTDTPEGELFQNILAAFAAYDRARFARRTKAGLKKKSERGEHLGRLPIGWRVDSHSKQLIHDEAEQRAMAKAVLLSKNQVAKLSSEKIAQELTDEFGLCRGRPWSARTVRRIIQRFSD